MSQLSYPINFDKGKPGMRADNADVDVVSRIHADVAQVSTETVGGTPTDGNYDVTIDGILVRTPRVGGSPSTNTDLAVAIAAAINDEPTLANIVTATSAVAVVTITAVHEGDPFTLSEAAPGPGTLVGALVTSSIVGNLPIGIFVRRVAGTDRNIVELTGADAVVDIEGIVELPIGQLENTAEGGPDDLTDDAFDSGSMVPIGRRGRWLMIAEDAVTPDDTVFVRFTATGSEQAGLVRSDADGGDALDASSILRFFDSVSAGGLVTIEVRIS